MDAYDIKENKLHDTIKRQQQLLAYDENTCEPLTQPTLTIDELFDFIENNFNTFRENSNLKALLPVVHSSVRLYARRDYVNTDIGLMLLRFYDNHNKNEVDMRIFVQILHQLLYSLDMCTGEELRFFKTVFIQLVRQVPTISKRVIVSNIVACLQLYIKIFQDNEILQTLWTDLAQRLKTQTASKTDIDILIQLFDEFCLLNPNLHNDPVLVNTVQFMLKSHVRDERKCGYYLFKKMISSFIFTSENVNNSLLSQDYSKKTESLWTFYITILENLEENQSHLILPSLENLNEILQSKQIDSEWLEILLLRILTHKNSLVIRWSIEFFLEKFTCSILSIDNLRQLLNALNSTVLYNFEGYFLEQKYFSSFLRGDLLNLYKQMGEINWKSVPLCNLITNLLECPPPNSMPFEQVLKIASRVRILTDVCIREKSASLLNKHFGFVIDKMTIAQYVTYIETLLTPVDLCDIFTPLFKKRPKFDEEVKGSIFQKRFYEIALNNIKIANVEMLISFLENIPLQKQGWLRFLPFHYGQHCAMHKVSALYGIDMDAQNEEYMPQENIEHFKNCQYGKPTKDELEQVQLVLTVIRIYKLANLDEVSDDYLSEMLMHQLSERAIAKLCLILNATTKILNSWTINRIIDLVSRIRHPNYEFRNVCAYLDKQQLWDEYIEQMLEKCPKLLEVCNADILKYVNGLDFICYDVKKGESRIEECYGRKLFNPWNKNLSNLWLNQVRISGNLEYAKHLLKYHNDISKSKQRYFANSYEHRLKMKIAAGLALIIMRIEINTDILNEFWNIILNENNQLNISYFYEYLLSVHENRPHILLKKLGEAHHLASSQQISIMSVIYNACMGSQYEDEVFKMAVLRNFLALTMGANFHTRLFAQLALSALLKTDKFHNTQNCNQILQSINIATCQKVGEHLYDLRLYLHLCEDEYKSWCTILYVTNVPYDEMLLECDNVADSMNGIFKKCCDQFSKKLEISIKNNVTSSDKETCYNQLQRKMNPPLDIIEQNNLFIFPIDEANTEMFVIATLIDKLPNLGGIARTCEVLGIRNIVMDSKKDIEKNDFKSLSMTAEKSINIIEVKQKDLGHYILNKQKEGFAVVGAEQTNRSQTFADFKFPPKCILLLG